MLFDVDGTCGEWFTFIPSHIDENTGEVVWGDPIPGMKMKIRHWKSFVEKRAMSREQVTEYVLNQKTRQMERQFYFKPETNEERLSSAIDAYDYALMEIDGDQWVDKKTNQKIVLTRDNKHQLVSNNSMVDRFFSRCLRQIENSTAEQTEEAEKN